MQAYEAVYTEYEGLVLKQGLIFHKNGMFHLVLEVFKAEERILFYSRYHTIKAARCAVFPNTGIRGVIWVPADTDKVFETVASLLEERP